MLPLLFNIRQLDRQETNVCNTYQYQPSSYKIADGEALWKQIKEAYWLVPHMYPNVPVFKCLFLSRGHSSANREGNYFQLDKQYGYSDEKHRKSSNCHKPTTASGLWL